MHLFLILNLSFGIWHHSNFFKPDDGSAAYDLRASQSQTIEPRSRKLLDTSISLAMPEGVCALIISRSAFSINHGLENGAGLIDPSYRGLLKVVLHNHSDKPFCINSGDRIAQILFFALFLARFYKGGEF